MIADGGANDILQSSVDCDSDPLTSACLNLIDYVADVQWNMINDMYAGDYNPMHMHINCDFSCVGFLKLPPGYQDEMCSHPKPRHNNNGYINFIGKSPEGQIMYLPKQPKVGDFYLFRGDMLHMVYPFTSSGYRRSFSINFFLR